MGEGWWWTGGEGSDGLFVMAPGLKRVLDVI